MDNLPEKFIKRLQAIIPSEHLSDVRETFEVKKRPVYRINCLKSNIQDIKSDFKANHIAFDSIPYLDYAITIGANDTAHPVVERYVADGSLYRQNLSSQLVPYILEPRGSEQVLDMCAAPGSKTSQIAALMENKGTLIAVEKVKARYFKLQAVLKLLGADNVGTKLADGRRFSAKDILFDKILVDAPCSSEGRFSCHSKKTYQYWSLRKIKEMQRKQKGLLLSASRLLAPGGTLIYATCTFAPEENEGVINWLLKKSDIGLQVVDCRSKIPADVRIYPSLTTWQGREYIPDVSKTARILPTGNMDGFFIAQLKKGP